MKLMSKKKQILMSLAVVVLVSITLALLIPVEKKHKLHEKWRELAEMAETDERAKFVIENESLYPEDIIRLCYLGEYDFDFAYNYPFHKDDYQTMTFTENELNCESVPALYMADFRWGYEKIGGYYIHSTGCVFTSLTMANLYLNHNSEVDPVIAGKAANELGILGMFGGVATGTISKEYINSLGMDCEIYDFTENGEKTKEVDMKIIQDIISENHVCMANFIGDTFGNHAVIITSCNSDGSMKINDPRSPQKTAAVWNFYDLEPELYRLWDLK